MADNHVFHRKSTVFTRSPFFWMAATVVLIETEFDGCPVCMRTEHRFTPQWEQISRTQFADAAALRMPTVRSRENTVHTACTGK